MKFDPEKYNVYTWKHPIMLHWVLNPGLAISELLFGQRAPKISLRDKKSGLPKFESNYIPCPHCHTIHDARIWSPQSKTGFGNWFGLYCPTCKDIIPCLINLTSLVILVITAPIWIWFKEAMKKRWYAKQADRYSNLDVTEIKNPYQGYGWIREGIGWGMFMFIFMNIVYPLFKEGSWDMRKVLYSLPFWIVGGLIYGSLMRVTVGTWNDGQKVSD